MLSGTVLYSETTERRLRQYTSLCLLPNLPPCRKALCAVSLRRRPRLLRCHCLACDSKERPATPLWWSHSEEGSRLLRFGSLARNCIFFRPSCKRRRALGKRRQPLVAWMLSEKLMWTSSRAVPAAAALRESSSKAKEAKEGVSKFWTDGSPNFRKPTRCMS